MTFLRTLPLIFIMALLAGCGGTGPATPLPLPTLITPERYATDVFLTQNAPPPGFGVVAYPAIDAGLEQVNGWHAQAEVVFEGVVDATGEPASGMWTIDIWYDRISLGRRVVYVQRSSGMGQAPEVAFEAVRLGDDAFMVTEALCIARGDDEARSAAALQVGELFGVANASATGHQAVINGQPVWGYDFDMEDILLRNVSFADGGGIQGWTGELWVAPDPGAVIRYYMTLDLTNALVFGGEQTLSGALLIRYDLLDVGSAPAIAIPFGC
jgi:hypothetical protein